MRRSLLAAVLALVAGAPGAADDPAAAHARYAEAVVDAAAASRDPRVLLAAASFAADSPVRAAAPALARKRDALGARAMALGADDPVVWAVLAIDCPLSADACADADAVTQLRRVAPNNALGWLLEAPGGDGDAHFARAAAANRYDTYEGEFVRALFEAASAVAPPAYAVDDMRKAGAADSEPIAHLALALGVALAQGWPQIGTVIARCGAGAGPVVDRDTCVAIARVLLNRSRNEFAQRLGTVLLAKHLPDGDERRAALASRRRLEWLQAQELAVLTKQPYPAALLAWLEVGADRFTVMRALLAAHGIAPEPPPGWRPATRSVLPAVD